MLSLAHRDPKLLEAVYADMQDESKVTTNYPQTQATVHKLLTSNPMVDPYSPNKPNFLKTAKRSLPSSSARRLTHLNVGTKTLRDAPSMAKALSDAWGPIWSHPNPPTHVIDDYLSDYSKRLGLDAIPEVSLELVQETINTARDSSTGPDGIPFSTYRRLNDIMAPILLGCFETLAKGGRPNRTFNYSNLFFFPKDSSMTTSKLRPISVGNCDNRLLSSLLNKLITPSLLKLINPAQVAFRPGQQIDACFSFFNERFHGMLENNRPYHILFHDFEKAYDRLSREYLSALLAKIGAPPWVRLMINSLLSNITASPILHSPHPTVIRMLNGLKQGCPLSPILFNLALDPLLTSLPAELDTRAYADDVACGSTSFKTIRQALSLFDRFSTASGLSTSHAKTGMVSTTLRQQADLARLLPLNWYFVTLKQEELYLGLPIGPSNALSSPFDKGIAEIKRRVNAYLPFRKSYSIRKRVLITNTFLLSSLLYAQRIFLMTPTERTVVWSLITPWLLGARRPRHSHRLLLIPRSAGGMPTPLRDVELQNYAALLRHRKAKQLVICGPPPFVAIPHPTRTQPQSHLLSRLPPPTRKIPARVPPPRTDVVVRSRRKKATGPGRDLKQPPPPPPPRVIPPDDPITKKLRERLLRNYGINAPPNASYLRVKQTLDRYAPPTLPATPQSRRSSVHVWFAANMFARRNEGLAPEPNQPQAALMSALAKADGSNWKAYTTRLTNRLRDPDRDALPRLEAEEKATQITREVKARAEAAPRMSDDLQYHLFQLIHNNVPTRHHDRFFKHIEDTSCRLCGRADETLHHLLSSGDERRRSANDDLFGFPMPEQGRVVLELHIPERGWHAAR